MIHLAFGGVQTFEKTSFKYTNNVAVYCEDGVVITGIVVIAFDILIHFL